MALRRSPVRASLGVFAICAAWPVTLGILWLTTTRTVPTINVRWVPSITVEQRTAAERELRLVWQEPKEPGTVRYFLMDDAPENLKKIVFHPLAEDTAFINRGTLALENSPPARTWIGDRFTSPWPSTLLYVSLFGCVISAVLLRLRD